MEKLTVLVVDDDREIVESIAIFLQADGYLVRKAIWYARRTTVWRRSISS